MRRGLGLILLALSFFGLVTFPVAALPLLLALIAYVTLLWFRPSAWLLVLPALVAGLDLTPYSGRLLVNEFDLFLLATVAMGLWHREYWRFTTGFDRNARRLLALLIAAQLLFTLHGLWPIPPLDADALASYLNPYNSLRMAKGFAFALLLLPMLQQIHARGESPGRLFIIGMLIGLSVVMVTIFWERYVFTGLFSSPGAYSITGLFAGMHNGGASINAFLIMTAAFLPAALLYLRPTRFPRAGQLLLALAAYALVVTLSRSDLLALSVMALVYVYAKRRFLKLDAATPVKPVSGLTWFAFGVVSVVLLGALGMAARGGLLSDRLSSVQARVGHWAQSTSMMQDGIITALTGMGKGRFPRTRLWRDLDVGTLPSTYQRMYDDEGNAFLRIGRSDTAGSGLSIHQRIAIDAGPGKHRLQLRLRTPNNDSTRLLLEFCERNILKPRLDCRWTGINTRPGQNIWQSHEVEIDLTNMGQRHGLYIAPVEIALLNRGLSDSLDIDDVQLISPNGKDLLANAGFDDGMDHWLPHFENQRDWHIGNLWFDAWFEGGLLGLLILGMVFAYPLKRLHLRIRDGDIVAMPLAMALSGVFLLGLFTSLFDDPRITLMFYLLVWLALLPPETALNARSVLAGQPSPDADPAPSGFRRLPRLVRYGIVFGVLAAIAIAAGLQLRQIMRVKQLDQTQIVVKLAELLGVDAQETLGVLLPSPKYADYAMDGELRALHPRILLPELSGWDGRSVPMLIQDRQTLWKQQKLNIYSACTSGDLVGNVSCWLSEGNARRGTFLLSNALKLQIVKPTVNGNQYGNAWQLAIAADFLNMEPEYRPEDRTLIQKRLVDALNDYLIPLDGNAISVWHGRLTMASNAWIVAASLDVDTAWKRDMVRRAQAHFVEAVRALAMSESWPSGFNYWINSRAYTFALAVSAYVNGVKDARNTPWMRNTLERTGLWMVYATRPDNRISELGDEGPRVDLKDETRRVIDIIASVTRNPVFATYSRYLAKLHRNESYYRGYRGTFQLLNDPTVAPYPDVEPGTLVGLEHHLPDAELFGPGAMNLAFIRSGWGPDDTFISFRAGSTLTHHGHYDAGHFTLFKGTPLALTSGTYGEYFQSHRLDYSIRTIAKNSLLILRPGETVQPNERFRNNVADGGQRVIIPTGSAIASIADFKANLGHGMHYEGGQIEAFSHSADEYTYIAADLTDAYNNTRHDEMDQGGKVSKVRRELLYLDQEDRLLIHDHVVSTQPDYVKKWLLHTATKPQVDDARVRVGTADNGILETGASHAVVDNGRGHLDVQRLYPLDAVMRLIGGTDYRFYVETDGDETALDGANLTEGVKDAKWFDTGLWRIEVQPGKARIDDHFLVALHPRLDDRPAAPVQAIETGQPDSRAVATDESLIVFLGPDATPPLDLMVPAAQKQLYLAGVPEGAQLRINGQAIATEIGMKLIRAPLSSAPMITLNWSSPDSDMPRK